MSTHSWNIEYTDSPPIKTKHKKLLEKKIQTKLRKLSSLVKGESEYLELGGKFYVERINVPIVDKPLLAVEDDEGNWIATLTFREYPCLSLSETRKIMEELDVNTPFLIPIAQKTVEEAILELEEFIRKANIKEVFTTLKFLKNLYEEALKKGIINVNDKIKDAHKKILNQLRIEF